MYRTSTAIVGQPHPLCHIRVNDIWCWGWIIKLAKVDTHVYISKQRLYIYIYITKKKDARKMLLLIYVSREKVFASAWMLTLVQTLPMHQSNNAREQTHTHTHAPYWIFMFYYVHGKYVELCYMWQGICIYTKESCLATRIAYFRDTTHHSPLDLPAEVNSELFISSLVSQ